MVDAHHLGLGHVFIGKAHPFAAKAAVLEAAKRHGVEAVIGRVVDHHAPRLDPPRQLQRRRQVPGKHSRMQAVFRRIGQGNGLIQGVERLKDHHRREHFL
ncbi:hypothetical protein D3C79_781480 [compost metagenome]